MSVQEVLQWSNEAGYLCQAGQSAKEGDGEYLSKLFSERAVFSRQKLTQMMVKIQTPKKTTQPLTNSER